MPFTTGVILKKEDICNLEAELSVLNNLVSKGSRVVVYGQRNTGKTSLLKSSVISTFVQSRKKAFVLFVDLMGVTSLDSINTRVRISFEHAMTEYMPAKSMLRDLVDSLKSFRPSASVDPLSGEFSFSLDTDKEGKQIPFDVILKEVAKHHSSNGALIVLDEFQDVSFVSEALAMFRNTLQCLPGDLPIIISGSKKHLLAKIFSPSAAPFAGWGEDVEIPTIRSEEYRSSYFQYILKEFKVKKLEFSKEVSNYLIDELQNIPEAVNIVCGFVEDNCATGSIITTDIINKLIKACAVSRTSRFEEFLTYLTANEQKVLIAVAKFGPVQSTKGKKFLSRLGSVSPSAVYKIILKLENSAEIYKLEQGYILSDPLLAHYLKIMR